MGTGALRSKAFLGLNRLAAGAAEAAHGFRHAVFERIRRQAMPDRDFGKPRDTLHQRRQVGDRQVVAGIDVQPFGKRRIRRPPQPVQDLGTASGSSKQPP